MAETIKNNGTAAKNVAERQEVTRLKKIFNRVRGWSRVFGFIAIATILFLQFLREPISNLISRYVSYELIELPWLRGLAWKLLWTSLIVWYGTHAIKIVQQFERATIRRLGKWRRTRIAGPSLILYPFETIKFEIVAEQAVDISKQQVNSSEGIPFPVDAIIWVKITNLYAAHFNVKDWWNSVYNVAMASIRDAASIMELLEYNQKRTHIKDIVIANVRNASTQEGVLVPQIPQIPKGLWGLTKRILTLYSQEEKQETGWGLEATRVEIQEIEIPKEIADAVKKVAEAQQKAIEAASLKKAAIKEAEGKAKAIQLTGTAEAEITRLKVEAEGGAPLSLGRKFADGVGRGDLLVLGKEMFGIPEVAAAIQKAMKLAGEKGGEK